MNDKFENWETGRRLMLPSTEKLMSPIESSSNENRKEGGRFKGYFRDGTDRVGNDLDVGSKRGRKQEWLRLLPWVEHCEITRRAGLKEREGR